MAGLGNNVSSVEFWSDFGVFPMEWCGFSWYDPFSKKGQQMSADGGSGLQSEMKIRRGCHVGLC